MSGDESGSASEIERKETWREKWKRRLGNFRDCRTCKFL